MKKTAILAGLLFAVMSGVFGQVSAAGQTYYYKYVESVSNSTGVRKKETDCPNIYITFTKTGCYNSDNKGHEKEYGPSYDFYNYHWNHKNLYLYPGEKNNLFVFMYHYQNSVVTRFNGLRPPDYALSRNEQFYYYFSKDYKRLNMRIYYMEYPSHTSSLGITSKGRSEPYWDNSIYVYERADPPRGPEDGPDVFY
jgi:hypothetical protein